MNETRRVLARFRASERGRFQNPSDLGSIMRVETYSSFAYAVEPRAFEFENAMHRVERILKQWRTPGQIHFYVRDEHDDFFELTYAEVTDAWSLRTFGKNCPPV
jgi:hypothetical protein